MACGICREGVGKYIVKDVQLCPDCYMMMNKLKKHEPEAQEWLENKVQYYEVTKDAEMLIAEYARYSVEEENGHDATNAVADAPLRSLREFDYDLHGLNPVFDIFGNRGRRIVVYENKCVIDVSFTLGSILSKNAFDGEKTIFYKDVIGVQYKNPGLAIGFLQLETASGKGNNLDSNFFDENSFTFGESEKQEVYKAYKYILSRIETIKMKD